MRLPGVPRRAGQPGAAAVPRPRGLAAPVEPDRRQPGNWTVLAAERSRVSPVHLRRTAHRDERDQDSHPTSPRRAAFATGRAVLVCLEVAGYHLMDFVGGR